MKFRDTELLPHPVVRKAYWQMRRFFSGGDDFARQAVRAGEALSKYAIAPDPDAVAACVLLDGMIIPYQSKTFVDSVSQRAASYVQWAYDLDVENPVYRSEGERQILLARAIVGLDDIRQDIAEGKFWGYRDAKKKLDLNEKNILAVVAGTSESGMAQEALRRLAAAQETLEKLVRERQEKMLFRNTGLPDHPTVRKAYEYGRAAEIKVDPLYDNHAKTGLGIAKVLLETGATSDPDVIGAALLNQYWAKKKGELAKEFSLRLDDIYRQTSPFSSGRKEKTSEEALLIDKAFRLYLLETMLEEFRDLRNRPRKEFDKYAAGRMLENIEYYAGGLERALGKDTPQDAFERRMQKAIFAADIILYTPANMRVRKPGSPPMDFD